MEITNSSGLVRICMLTYNRADYINEAILSVLAQTYQNWNLIIIDDGSTDNTRDIVVSHKDARIEYIQHKENLGLYERRAESLRVALAKGEFVAVLDSDDVWADTQKLSKQVVFLNQNPSCAVVGSAIIHIDAAGKETHRRHFLTDDASIRDRILTQNQFANSSVLMRSSLLKKTKGYLPFAPAEDYELFLQLGQFGTFANFADYMLRYRIHTGGITGTKRRHHLAMIGRVIDLHRKEYPHYVRAKMVNIVRYLKSFL